MTRRTSPTQLARICDAIGTIPGGATEQEVRLLLTQSGSPQQLTDRTRPHLRLLLHRYALPGEEQLWILNQKGSFSLTAAGAAKAASVPENAKARNFTLERHW